MMWKCEIWFIPLLCQCITFQGIKIYPVLIHTHESQKSFIFIQFTNFSGQITHNNANSLSQEEEAQQRWSGNIYISTSTRDSKAGRRYCWRCWLYHLNDKFLLLFSGKDCGASLESALIPGSTCTFGIPIVIMVLRKNNGWWCRFVW